MANSNRNNNNNNQEPFWAWVNSHNMDHPNRAGAGVDHAAAGSGPGFPWAAAADGSAAFGSTPWSAGAGWGPWGPAFGGHGPWGRGGPSRHGHDSHPRHGGAQAHEEATEGGNPDSFDAEKSPGTVEDATDVEDSHDHHHPPHPPPPPFHLRPHPSPPPPPPPHPPHHPHGPGAGHRGRGRGRGCGWPRGGHGHGRGAHRGRHDGSPPPEYNGPFDFRPLMHAFNHHPFADTIRDYISQVNGRARSGQTETNRDSIVPPVDIFNTENAYVLHVALPGCSKEDVGVHWDADKGEVKVAGVIYRPGDETFVQGLVTGERRIGMFERNVKVPPTGVDEKEDIDGFNITAKMENGLLVITIPKVEKEWTEVRKVDIE